LLGKLTIRRIPADAFEDREIQAEFAVAQRSGLPAPQLRVRLAPCQHPATTRLPRVSCNLAENMSIACAMHAIPTSNIRSQQQLTFDVYLIEGCLVIGMFITLFS
jgi:hypothetical protein